MRYYLTAVLVFGLAASNPAYAESAREKGERIAKQADSRDQGYRDYTATGNMILKSASGRQSKRDFDFRLLNTGGGSKSLLTFNWPGDIRDTSLLTHTFSRRDDSQWVFLPAANRVKRISSSGRSGSFVGSEFSYEDMVNQEVAKFDHVWTADRSCPNYSGTCHVLERTPKFRSGYAKQIVWIDTRLFKIRQIDYYNKRGDRVKTLSISGYRTYSGRYREPGRLVMTNHLNKRSTQLNWANYRFDTGLNAAGFTTREMQRLR